MNAFSSAGAGVETGTWLQRNRLLAAVLLLLVCVAVLAAAAVAIQARRAREALAAAMHERTLAQELAQRSRASEALAAAEVDLAGAPDQGDAALEETPDPRRIPPGELLVLNKTDSTLSFVDPKDARVLAVVGTGVGPHEIAVEPGGARAVVSNYGGSKPGSSLTLIDLEKRVALDTLDLGAHRRPHGIAFRSAKRVLVTCEASQALIEVDLGSLEIVREMATDQKIAHMVVVAPHEPRAFVANIGSGSISAFDLEAGALIAHLPTGKGAEGLAITPDGAELWVGNREQDTLSIVDAKTLELRATLECASFPIRVQITPDGARALVSNAKSGEVAVFDVRSRKELARLSLAVSALERRDGRLFGADFEGSPVPVGILIEPGGKWAFVANTNADVVSVLDLEQLSLGGRLRAGREPDGLGWIAR